MNALRWAVCVLACGWLFACGGGGGGNEVAWNGHPLVPTTEDLGPGGPTGFEPIPNQVLGQANFLVAQSGSSGARFDDPASVAVASDLRVFVADANNHRVLVFPASSVTVDQTATFALGQAGVGTGDAHPVAQGTLSLPRAVAIGAGRLAVADTGNHRVLVYPSVPTQTSTPTVVLGQANFGSNSPGILRNPSALAITPGGKLIVGGANNQLLVWNSVTTVATNQPPDLVLGTANASGSDGLPASALEFAPSAIWSDDTKLVVASGAQNRVLVWNNFPQAGNAAPDIVLGQSSLQAPAMPNDFDHDGTTDATPSGRTMYMPTGIASNGQRLVVADTGNNRLLVWHAFPTQSFQRADAVVGQPTFAARAYNDGNRDGVADAGPSATVFRNPRALLFHSTRMLVVDSGNYRVLSLSNEDQ